MANADDIHMGYQVANAIQGCVSGSVLVDPDKAADVDIWVSDANWGTFSYAALLEHYDLKFYNPLDGSDLYEDAKVYKEIEHVLRSAKYNLNVIVVRDYFVPAYVYGTRMLRDNPSAYDTKDKRANLFIEAKNRIHEMLGNPQRPLRYFE